jgi:DNA-binding transcriptional LysR family regulator
MTSKLSLPHLGTANRLLADLQALGYDLTIRGGDPTGDAATICVCLGQVSLAAKSQPTADSEEVVRRKASGLLMEAEKRRREGPTVSVAPIAGVIDYSAASLWLGAAMHHLDEALPSGQRERAAVALELLELGARHLRIWMDRKGFTKAQP